MTPLGLCRTAQFTPTRAGEATGDGLTLEGYASVFDQPTNIDSWEGSFVEQVRRGAFRKTIRERVPVLQFDHGRHPLVGSIPIGAIRELREDDQGLYVSAQLSDNWLVQPVRDAIRDGAVDGMSFRFEVVREEWRDAAGKVVKPDELADLLWNPGERGPLQRTLIELRVPELGPVVFPAYAGTSVGVRASQIAGAIMGDAQLRREVRAALAIDVPEPPTDDPASLGDPQIRADVARELLFRTAETPDTPPAEEPVDDGPPAEDVEPTAEEAEDVQTTDAPPDQGHPSSTKDAPPATGHPSPTDRASRMKAARIAYVTRNGVGKRY